MDRIVAIGFGGLEAEGLVERLGALHRGERVEEHAFVAEGFGFDDQGEGELAAEAEIAASGADVKALHFAVGGGEAPEGAAAEEFVVLTCEEKRAGRWRVFVFEVQEFFVEVLEVEVDV